MSWRKISGRSWGRLGMKYKLSDICFYAKGKIDVSGLTDTDYISTENMLPNKGGVTIASSLPRTAFLYYVLADNAFFNYSTATSKGTKMPRGDKTTIMQYGVPHFDLPTQRKIAGILADIDDKIALNNNINNNLPQLKKEKLVVNL